MITKQQADARASRHTAPKVTRGDVEAAIDWTQYVVHGTLTVCIATLRNGFKLVGTSAAASPENFDAEIGQRYALEDVYRQTWPLLGYALREKLAAEAEGGRVASPAGGS